MKRKVIYIFISLLVLIPSLLIMGTSLRDIVSSTMLTLSGETTTADVLSTRINTSTTIGTLYEIRYAFELEGKHYVHGLIGSNKTAWVAMPKENWESAKTRGTVEVLYKKDNPEINQPVFFKNIRVVDTAALLTLFLVISIVCGISIHHNLMILSHHFHKEH